MKAPEVEAALWLSFIAMCSGHVGKWWIDLDEHTYTYIARSINQSIAIEKDLSLAQNKQGTCRANAMGTKDGQFARSHACPRAFHQSWNWLELFYVHMTDKVPRGQTVFLTVCHYWVFAWQLLHLTTVVTDMLSVSAFSLGEIKYLQQIHSWTLLRTLK